MSPDAQLRDQGLSARPVGGSAQPGRLAFVVSPSRHGATLVALLLNNHSSITALGDTNPTREYDQTCACGQRVSQCPFWSTVRERLNLSRFADLHTFLPILPAPLENHHLDGGLVSVSGNATVNRLAGRWAAATADRLLPLAWRANSRAVPEYVRTWDGFYDLARELQDTSLVVDGSKNARKVELLAGALPSQEVRVIHLVRDPRGFVASVRRQHPKIDLRGQAWLWSDLHRRMERLASSVPYLRLRYEDLVLDPERHIGSMFDFLGVEREPVLCAPRYPHKHHLMGNAMLFSFDGKVALDERWRAELTGDEVEVIVRHARAGMARYGYA